MKDDVADLKSLWFLFCHFKQGDILLFLTGEEEIEDVCRKIRTEAEGLGKASLLMD